MPGQNAEKQAWDEKMPEKNARPKSLKKTLSHIYIQYFCCIMLAKSACFTHAPKARAVVSINRRSSPVQIRAMNLLSGLFGGDKSPKREVCFSNSVRYNRIGLQCATMAS